VEAPTVVVVEDSNDGASDAVDAVVVEAAIENAGELAQLRAMIEAQDHRIDELEMRVIEASITASVAAEVAEEAETDTEELNAEFLSDEAEEASDDAIEPDSAKVHPLFRTREQWRDR
jgi:aldehyde:ferredoxin oxidoreductase